MGEELRRRMRFRIKTSVFIEEVGTTDQLKEREKQMVETLTEAMKKLPVHLQGLKVKPIGWEEYDADSKKWVPVEPAEEEAPGTEDV